MTPIVLCSTAAHRAALLRRLGLPFEATRPDFDENGLEHLPPADLAAAYALGKARSLVERYADAGALLIGADQVPEVDGEVLRKAETPEECAAQLARLSGREHTLHTAVAIVDAVTGRAEVARTAVRLTMRLLSAAQIRRYVEADRPMGSAGGYTYEGLGVSLFADVRGQDDSAIVGLPLVAVVELLGRFGVDPLGSP
jgi:septum formation protein